MIFVVFVLVPVFLITLYMMIKDIRSQKKEAVLRKMVPQFRSPVKTGSRFFAQFQDKKTREIVIVTAGAIAGGVFALIRGGSPILAALVGAAIPYAILKQMQYNYEKKFREGGNEAVNFLGGILAANGTLEDWLEEVIPRLRGPIKPLFEQGYENYLKGVPVTKFLEALMRECPDSSLNLIFSGILREQREAGNLQRFVEEAIKDMQNQDRLMRRVLQIRKSGSQMLMYICSFPVFFYLLFMDTVNYTLSIRPITNLYLLIAIAGYIFFIWWGLRVTKSKQ